MNQNSQGLHAEHQPQNDTCPECGSLLHIRNSKQGAFLGCSNYPKCTYLRPLHEKSEIKKVLTGTSCPLCAKELVLKQGRYGLFIGCSAYPDCLHTAQLSENTDKKEKSSDVPCPSCKKGMLIRALFLVVSML